MSNNNYTSWLQTELANLLNQSPQAISTDTVFFELGLDSVTAVRLSGIIASALDAEIEPTLLFDYPTLRILCTYLEDKYGDRNL
jgi:acyl carrier protein